MCFCCCFTKLSVLVYLVVINSLFVIFGILVIATFGSDTQEYKIAKPYLDMGQVCIPILMIQPVKE